MRVILGLGVIALGVGVFGSVACGGNSSAGLGNVEAGVDGAVGGSSGDGGGSAAGGTGGATGGTGGGASGAGGATGGASGSAGSDAGPGCNPTADEDYDADGFSITDGDCDDCDADVNPGAYEITPGGVDDDCDGIADNAATCDDALAIDDATPANAARAIELCKTATATDEKWGVLSASWVQADGAAPPSTALANFHLGHGNLNGFGTNVTVQAGQRLLALSSGTARDAADPGYQSPGGFNKGYSGGHPQGFPKESPSCPGVTTGTPYDATGLEVKIRVPTNAVAFEYDEKFYTYEWPAYVCSQYNDFFVAMLTPTPVGQTDGNVAFDALGNPFSVNNDLLEVCGCTGGPPCQAGGKSFTCSLGITDLAGTGFETHAGTGWLTTRVPVQGGSEITIRFAAYDSGDGILDSTVLLDNWRWLSTGAPAQPVTTAKP